MKHLRDTPVAQGKNMNPNGRELTNRQFVHGRPKPPDRPSWDNEWGTKRSREWQR